jgi:peptidoglycan/xylan/chitin deacetylase (PgdA/CDA1 family)
MDRRSFLLALAGGLAAAAVGRGATGLGDTDPAPVAPSPAAASGSTAEPPAAPPVIAAAPALPPTGVVQSLPGDGTSLALTIDDGTNSEVVAAFAAFAADSGTRLTFFPNGCYRSWADNAKALRPLVDSGQVTLGNHTWSHPDLTTLTDGEIAEEIGRNRDFLRSVFGVRETPFFRPPYGARNARVDRIAADQGHPSVVLWNGTLEDSRVLTADELMAAAQKWFTAQRIVIGHANHPTVTTLYGDLLALIAERNLRTVTLADVWSTPAERLRGITVSGRAGLT